MIKSGLKKLREKKWYEKQDYSARKTFGSVLQLPDEYFLPSKVLNQGSSQKCTAYASCAIQEGQEKISFDPDDYYFQEGITAGKQSDNGYDLRVCMKTCVRYGIKPLNSDNGKAEDFKEESYFRVDNPLTPMDLYDECKQAIYSAKEEKKTICTGGDWRSEWNSPDGIIPNKYSSSGSGHCVKICGWKKINGVEYLIVQNSYGTNFGDRGFNYFPREVINKEFTYGSFLWREKGENIQTMSKLIALLIQLKSLYEALLKLCGIK